MVNVEKVVVKGKRIRYKKKGNPAVELAMALIAGRDNNSPLSKYQTVDYQRYERILIALDNFKRIDTTKKLAFLNEHIIINEATDKPILPIMLKERVIQTHRKGPSEGGRTEVELLNQSKGLDERFSQESVMAYLKTALPEIDLFADIIPLVQRHFMGPLSKGATSFYKFNLAPDTLAIEGRKYVVLNFFPYSKESMGLRGSIVVSTDSLHFIKEVDISIPNSADVNWIKNLQIRQQYIEDSTRTRILDRDILTLDFSITKGTNALAVRRENSYSMYKFNESQSSTVQPANIVVYIPDSIKNAAQNEKLEKIAPGMRRSGFYKFTETVLMLLTEGYVGTSRKSYVDIGPVATFLTGNPLEGTRLSVGGMTTANVHPNLFLEARVGYGIKDEVWKYMGAVEWSFIKKKRHFREFPVHSLRAMVSYDTHRFGESFADKESENVFSWAKRMPDSSLTYVQRYELAYAREFKNHLSFTISARHYIEKESAVMSFYPTRGTLTHYKMTELELGLRYAPGEVIYQSKFRRHNLQKYSAIIDFHYTLGIPNFLGSTYRRNLTELSLTTRVGIQPLGYIDFDAKLGAEWSKVPYMLLPHPLTDPSYVTANNRSFSFMNPLEFLYDRYAFWGITYHMDGFLLSRIPLIKKLKLREVFTFKGVWGHLSKQNNPNLTSGLIPLPYGCSPIGHEPYMELGVGIENIFSIFRIDYVWRITYLDQATSITGGIMLNISLKF